MSSFRMILSFYTEKGSVIRIRVRVITVGQLQFLPNSKNCLIFKTFLLKKSGFVAAVISFFKVSYDSLVLVVDVSTFKIRTFYFQLTWISMPDPNTRDGKDWYRKRLFLLGPSVLA